MGETYNIFISWSGERSEKVAAALYGSLKMMLQSARPWMSKEDIEKGSRGLDEIGKALDTMSVGVICLTPENVERPWILFEAGALSKTVGEKTRVCPYLFGGLRSEQVRLPLGMFQAARAEKEETRKMVLAVNRAIGGVEDEGRVDTWFEREWPELEKKLAAIPAAKAAAPQVDEKKLVEQVLDLAQSSANSSAKLREELRGVREVVERVMDTLHPPSILGLGNRATGPLSSLNFYGDPVLGRRGFGMLSDLAGTPPVDPEAMRALARVAAELAKKEEEERAAQARRMSEIAQAKKRQDGGAAMKKLEDAEK
ncbi:MAG: toll/interleukin-1 receptor domain-containing protein [Acidobacteria bacterium Pan2503]|uniref:Toll/interleukin-1 receptor domain-containing protein n=1 Tax=Candidatus Acidiferrum panamense TaxID=2741543 RepID=A0A7V8NT56_9BACT|nr:toll/interleukin-1 receptor domain-containing protein [Candidatus Acidoferrum panamensis]